TADSRVVFLLDVDNTLLDNDRVTADLRGYLAREVGADCAAYYFEVFERLRDELGYADYLGALQRYRVARPRDPRLLSPITARSPPPGSVHRARPPRSLGRAKRKRTARSRFARATT
ncbi:MAG TPA: hypothetical protein VML54_08005, partial [Candidatus Limnocylindrales bacterium]|nr:hypothetical protein [Candidatus Limnocylindrales bacterium]